MNALMAVKSCSKIYFDHMLHYKWGSIIMDLSEQRLVDYLIYSLMLNLRPYY